MNFVKKNLILCLTVCTAVSLPLLAKPSKNSARVVDFAKCFTDSAFGKKEQENFNQMKSQMEKAIQDLTNQMKETTAKLDDPFTLDSLSPEAEKELQNKAQTLSGELQHYQQQYYYLLQQANMKTMATMSEKIKQASHTLAEEEKYTLIMNQEQVFHYTPDLDVTPKIIAELDKMFDAENNAKNTPKAELSKPEAKKDK